MRVALASADPEAAWKVWNQIKADGISKESIKQQLTEEENLNILLLLNCGFVKGMRVKYVGEKPAEQFEGLDLTVENIDSYNRVCCKKPDGYYTPYLPKTEWQRL